MAQYVHVHVHVLQSDKECIDTCISQAIYPVDVL